MNRLRRNLTRRALLLVFTAGISGSGLAAAVPAETLYAAGDYARAEPVFMELAAREPAVPRHRYFLGKLAIHRGDYAAAIALLERVVEEVPQDAEFALWLANARAWAAADAGTFPTRAAHGRRALALYRRAVDLDPANVPARFGLMNFYRHVPAWLGGGLARARAEALEIARRDACAGLQARALLAEHVGDYGVALAELQELLRDHPDHYAGNFLLGRVAWRAGREREAGRAALERCLRLQPTENDESHAAVARLLAEFDRPPSRSAEVAAR